MILRSIAGVALAAMFTCQLEQRSEPCPLYGGAHLNLWDMTVWTRAFSVADEVGIKGLRVDLALTDYAYEPGKYDRKRLRELVSWAKRRGKNLRLILAYGPTANAAWKGLGGNWQGYTTEWRRCRPPAEAWPAMADAFNDAIQTVATSWGSGAEEAVAWEFWNEPYGRGADESFDRMAEVIVPRLRMQGMRLSGPTLHGSDLLGQIARILEKPYWRIFDELAINIYPEPQPDFGRAASRAIELARRALAAIRRFDSRDVHISETGLGAQSCTALRTSSFHEDRGQALGIMLAGLRTLGFRSVGLYSFVNADATMDAGSQFGLVDSRGKPYFPIRLVKGGSG